MRVACFSYREYEVNRQSWIRSGSNIIYSPTGVDRELSNQGYYTLSFDYHALHEEDTVLFANSFPYTYSDLQHYINKKMARKKELKIFKHNICKTTAGLCVYAIRLGEGGHNQNNSNSPSRIKGYGPEYNGYQSCSPKYLTSSDHSNNYYYTHSSVQKKSLVFIGRQHAGETPSSYMIEGVLDALLESRDFELLKKQFVIYVIPMLNPDGVFYGNYRTNLSGQDLNRKWRNPNKSSQPQIYYTRKFLSDINRVNPIALIIDFHGHSRKLGSFFYGNPSNQTIFNENTKILPLLCSKRNKRISFQDSTFFIAEDKKNTARVVLKELFPMALVYTFEASFHGFSKQRLRETVTQEFTVDSYRKIGKDILFGYMEFIGLDNKTSFQIKEKLFKEISDYAKNIVTEDTGSDSEPEADAVDFDLDSEKIRSIANQEKQNTEPSNLQIITIEQKKPQYAHTKQINIKDSQDKALGKNLVVNRHQERKQNKKTAPQFQMNLGSPNSMSILRIVPLKTPNMIFRNQTDDNLQTVRKGNPAIFNYALENLRYRFVRKQKPHLGKYIDVSNSIQLLDPSNSAATPKQINNNATISRNVVQFIEKGSPIIMRNQSALTLKPAKSPMPVNKRFSSSPLRDSNRLYNLMKTIDSSPIRADFSKNSPQNDGRNSRNQVIGRRIVHTGKHEMNMTSKSKGSSKTLVDSAMQNLNR